MENEKTIGSLLGVPPGLIKAELEGLYGSNVLQDMRNIISLYDIYENGAEFPKDVNKDFTPADLRFKLAKSIINKMARFLFSKSPDIYVDTPMDVPKAQKEANTKAASVYQTLVDRVLQENKFPQQLLKACKDCLVGKRVALVFNVNEETGMRFTFHPSLEFVYDVDENDPNKVGKIVVFYNMNEAKAKKDQRIYKKKFWMENGFAHYFEAIYDGQGQVVDVVAENTITKFTYVPAWVIINEGLTGDLMGESEIDDLESLEKWYSRLSSADMDAERQGMNEIKYTIDAAPASVKDLSIAPGAFWDLASDPNQPVDKAAQVGVLQSSMGYTTALGNTLNRLKNGLYEQAAVPNVSPEALQGVVTSGKTLKAIYWDLIVRCDEKMLAWSDALIGLAKCIIEGAKLYPKAISKYNVGTLPEVEYDIRVENQYSLPEDEVEEKTIDLAEVTAQTMSRKRYMKKWHRLTDDEAEEELKQIALERELLEDSFAAEPPPGEEVPPEENPPAEKTEKSEEQPEEEPEE